MQHILHRPRFGLLDLNKARRRPQVPAVVAMRHLDVVHHRSRLDAVMAMHRLEVIHSVRDWTDFSD